MSSCLFLCFKLSILQGMFFWVYLCLFLRVSGIIIMPKNTNRTRKIPKFIKKLKEILEDQKFFHLITWVPENNGFHIIDASKFIDEVLPKYFKHKNMASFVRQLNMYGFTRPKESDQNVYTHCRFIKGNLNSMRQIQRRISDRKESQSLNSATQSQSQIDEPSENSQMHQICLKLLQENLKLKKQNNQLFKKLSLLENQHQRLGSFTLMGQNSEGSAQMCDSKTCSKNQKQNFEQEKNSENSEKNKKCGFNFALNHTDWNSRLSYFNLINGAKNELINSE